MPNVAPRILALEPYAAPSHRAFLEELARGSRCDFEIATLPPRYWKWRMGTAALHFAPLVARADWDLLLVSDYLNLAELRGLLPAATARRPAVVYFHENQLTYPLQPGERRDIRFGFDHLNSALAADRAVFNSEYHRSSLRAALAELLPRVPDMDLSFALDAFDERCTVLPLGTELERGTPCQLGPAEVPILLWNHRWEYDKDPEALLGLERELQRLGIPHRLRLCGQRFRSVPPAFDELLRSGAGAVEDRGFLPRDEYLADLSEAHVILSTARHEFFGLGTLEALRLGALPVLPRRLAYPELLPELPARERFLYPPESGPLSAVLAAFEALRSGSWLPEQHAILEHTDRFAWPSLAPRYDALFDSLLS